MHDSRPQTQRRRRRRRWPWILLAAALTTVVVAVVAWVAISYSMSSRLRRAVAEADAADPNWRLGDLLASRESIPDDENSALRLAAAHAKLPAGWLTAGPEGGESLGARLFAAYDRLADDLAPNASFGAAELDRLTEDLEALSPALDEARTLADYPRGRWPLPPSPVFSRVGTLVMNRLGNVREVARLLRLEASARAMNGDVTGALDTARALLNAGRSIGDEPLMISQLVRMAIDGMAVSTIERVLAQGEADADEPLARLQGLLAVEAAAPLQLHAIRGERASMADTFERLASGEITMSTLAGAPPGGGRAPFDLGLPTAYFAYNEALVLEFMTDAVAIARAPLPEQQALWDAW